MSSKFMTRKEAWIKDAAVEDYEFGHPYSPDDFNEFKAVMTERFDGEALDEFGITRADFEKYFEFFDEARDFDMWMTYGY